MEAVGFGVFFVAWMVFVLGGMALWIYCIVDVVKLPEHAYRIAGKEKTTWILVVALAQFIGAIIWWFAARKDVKAAAAAYPYPPPPSYGPPPGWYPDPGGAPGSVWWDGRQWTGNRQPPP